uniref:C6 finger domain n=1 Tax=Mycena chlorophos TaxID=658473 RepID=A0ABQ0LCI9_MYCCL|nr:C6 finger domain [Mycena chlorophos]
MSGTPGRRAANSTRPSRRPRAFIACLNCRKRRVKCETEDDCDAPCERCVKRGLSCSYVPVMDVDAPLINTHPVHGYYPADPDSDLSAEGSPSSPSSLPLDAYYTLPDFQLRSPMMPHAQPLPGFDTFLRVSQGFPQRQPSHWMPPAAHQSPTTLGAMVPGERPVMVKMESFPDTLDPLGLFGSGSEDGDAWRRGYPVHSISPADPAAWFSG